MWLSALQLTFVGMGVTFAFLLIMTFVISLLGIVVIKFFPEKIETIPEPVIEEDKGIVAAIIAGISNRKH